ncbi:hypothetical protein BDP27DRAFT_1449042 [Rhodocollybia butyracea]|uniref:F-box domain-containing protein n=1 Tax=Rhodocollybia butyracea TaxID=206335 RepID=A0A9P5U750_9AGAR|nr:hypothetical protein BDP27DRAFT_1449042 [Rhodocollybia butyracea]
MDVQISNMSGFQSSIHPLPNEILSEVFIHYVFSFHPSLNTSDWVALKLGHICSRWRVVALGSQNIWSSIFIHITTPNKKIIPLPRGILPLVNLYLERSNAALLEIVLDHISMPILSLLMAHSRRWRRADFVIDKRFLGTKEDQDSSPISALRDDIPVLEHLRISMDGYLDRGHNPFNTTFNYFESAPKLSSLDVQFDSIFFTLDSLNFPWQNLISLTITCVGAIQIKPLLSLCPKLEQADFRFYGYPAVIHSPHSGLFVNTTLKRLTIESSEDPSQLCMNSWVLPSLEEVSLASVSPVSVQDITQMLERSNCSTIHSLSFTNHSWTSEQLLRLFINTPLLRHLKLMNTAIDRYTTFDDWLLHEMTYPDPDPNTTTTGSFPARREQLLPRLEKFIYLATKTSTINWRVLVTMIVSRSHGSPSGAAALKAGMAILSCVHLGRIEFGLSLPRLDETSMQNVRKLEDEGMEISTQGFEW